MKLASYQDGSRDGHLVVVSRDLSTAHYASGIATRLQQVLDDWNFLSPQLEDLSTTLNHGRARHAFAFEPALCLAPLPRAFQRVQALAQDAAEAAAPRLQQRSGSGLGGACHALAALLGASSLACAPALAVVTGDVAAGMPADSASEAVRLLLLMAELDGAGARFAPLAVTPDELGGAWRDGRARVQVDVQWQRHKLRADAAAAPWHFGELIAALAQAGPVGAGCIVGGGALSEAGLLGAGERLRVEVTGADGFSLFGAIDAVLPAPAEPAVAQAPQDAQRA